MARTRRARSKPWPVSGSARSTAGWCATAAASTTAARRRRCTTCASAARSCAICSSCSAVRSRRAWSSRWSARSRTSGGARALPGPGAIFQMELLQELSDDAPPSPAARPRWYRYRSPRWTCCRQPTSMRRARSSRRSSPPSPATKQRKLVRDAFSAVMKVVATYSIKGGVGKTSRSRQLRCARRPRRAADRHPGTSTRKAPRRSRACAPTGRRSRLPQDRLDHDAHLQQGEARPETAPDAAAERDPRVIASRRPTRGSRSAAASGVSRGELRPAGDPHRDRVGPAQLDLRPVPTREQERRGALRVEEPE